MALLLLILTAGGAGAVEIEGEWELRQLGVVVESRLAEKSDINDSDIRIGETLALALNETKEKGTTIVIDRSDRMLQMDSMRWGYHMHEGRVRVEEEGERLDFIFSKLGDALIATIIISGQSSLNQVMIFEAIPGKNAAIGPFDGGSGGNDVSRLRLEGSRFVNSSNDIIMEFRSNKVKITVMGQTAGTFEYEQEGNYVYVNDPNAGMVEYEIVDKNTLSTDHYGLTGDYHRE